MAGAEFGPDSVSWVEELSFPKLGEGPGYLGTLAAPPGWILFMGWGRAAGGFSHSTCGKGVQMLSYRQRACNKVEMCRL